MTHWAKAGDHGGFDTATAETIEPSLDWQPTGTRPTGSQITIQAPDTGDPVTEPLVVVRSDSGTSFLPRTAAQQPFLCERAGRPSDVSGTASRDQGW
jgi:hypothetical protein